MISTQKYKNTLLSLSSYFFVFIWYLLYSSVVGPYWLVFFPAPESFLIVQISIGILFVPCLLLLALGVFFASKSVDSKESTWIGTALGIIGILALLFFLFFYAFAFKWSTVTS